MAPATGEGEHMAAAGTRSRATQAATTGRRAKAEKTQADEPMIPGTRLRRATAAERTAAANDIIATPKRRGRPAATATAEPVTTTRTRRTTATAGSNNMAAAGKPKATGSKGAPAEIKKGVGGTPKKTATAGSKKGK